MKDIAKQWVAKAEGDFTVARRLARMQARGLESHACFHSYECADKYLKAILAEEGVRFRFMLPLIEAYERLARRSPDWVSYRSAAEWLNQFDDSILYPGHTASRQQASTALRQCRRIRGEARRQLGLLNGNGQVRGRTGRAELQRLRGGNQ